MSRLRQSLVQHSPFGWDSLEDPLNDGWDAVVRRDRPASPDAELDDVALLRRVHALDATTLPSPNFLGDLEQRLRELYPTPGSTPEGVSRAQLPRFGNPPPPSMRQIAPPRTHRRIFMPAAMAVLALVLITSLGVRYFALPRSPEPPAIPAATLVEPTMETMVQLDFTPSDFGMPEASTWTDMYFNLIQIDPGTSFTTDTDWYTWIDGPLLIQVLSGELTIHPAGPARFYPDSQRDQNPEEISPGQSVSLGPGAAIYYSAVDAATGSNPGSEPVMALQVSIGHLSVPGTGPDAAPIDIKNLDRQMDWQMDAPPSAGASISIQRLRLAPFDSFVFDPDPESTYFCVFDPLQMDGVRIAKGALDGLAPNVDTDRLYASTQLTYPDPGPHTIVNLGDETTNFYFLVVEALPEAGVSGA